MPSTSHRPAGPSTDADRSNALKDLSGKALRGANLDDLFAFASRSLVSLEEVVSAGIFELRRGEHPSLVLRAGHGWAGSDDQPLTLPVSGVSWSTAEPAPLGVETLTQVSVTSGRSVLLGSVAQPFGVLIVAYEGSQPPADASYEAEVASLLAASIERDQVVSALRSSEQRLAMAQRIAHMGSYDWHIASNTNVWSDELYRIYGTEPQSFNASYERFLSFIHPDDRDKISAIHAKAYETGEPYEMEERIVRPDGEVRILQSNGEVITDDDGTPVRMVGICFDVTEQRRAEETARRYYETQMARRQAFELNDSVVQGLATVVHALESERDELALEASRRTLSAARGMMNDLLSMATDEDLMPGHLVRSDPPASMLEDLPAEEPPAAGPSQVRMVIADDSEDMRMMLRFGLGHEPGFEVIAEASDGVEAVAVVEEHRPDVILLDLAMPKMDGLEVIGAIRERAPGTKIVVLSGFDADRMRPLALKEGAHAYIEKGKPIAELKRTVVELVPNMVLEEHGAMPDPRRSSDAAGPELLAHEMRTPVTVIESLVNTVKGRTERLPSSAVDELFEALGRNAAQLVRLLDDFEDVLRLGEGALTLRTEETRIPVLIHTVVRDLTSILGSRQVRMQVEEGLTARVDPFRVRQIVSNLLSNAAKFSPEGSTITVVARADGDDLIMSVADEGPGVAPERRDELFQRFSRLGAKGQGLGLGLALSRGLARAHGGDLVLDVDRDPGGATFSLRLPLHNGDRSRSS